MSEDWEQQLGDAYQIAETAQHLLDDNRVELRITINRCSQNAMLPAPQVIHAVNRFVSAFDTYSIPTEQPAASLLKWTEECNSNVFSCCHSQVTALADSSFQVSTVQTKCDLDWDPDVFESWCYDGLIAAVATMTHLTKLHLSLADYFDFSAIDLEPLACLTSLKDLALQCFDNPGLDCLRICDSVCCQGVLESNKQTLHCVTLTGPWTAATYYMLHKCSKLETLSISISELNVEQAKALASISADSFRLTLHQQLEPIVLAAINHSQPQIHMLTTWGIYQKEALKLPQLLSLHELTLVNFVPFTIVSRVETHDSDVDVVGIAAHAPGYCPVTGEALECCPMVTKLTLIDCPGITSKGLKHVIEKAMPALQTLSIQATRKPDMEFLGNCARTASFDADGLHALCLGSSLRSIDLRGVSGLTTEALLSFKVDLHLKQCQGHAPSSIDLLLPHAASLDKAVFSLRTNRSMFLPNIFRTSDCGDIVQMVL